MTCKDLGTMGSNDEGKDGINAEPGRVKRKIKRLKTQPGCSGYIEFKAECHDRIVQRILRIGREGTSVSKVPCRLRA